MSVEVNNIVNDVKTVVNSISSLFGVASGVAVPDSTTNLMLNCASVTIPSLNITTAQDKRYGIGTVFTYPDGKDLQPVTLSFYETNSGIARQYFSNWINSIYDPKTRKFNYLGSIAKTITISQYDRSDNLIYQCILRNAFCTHVSELNRAYSMADVIDTMSVSIVFQDMEEKFIVPGLINTALSFLSFLPNQ